MKFRNGFVSNSSSASFIVALPYDKNIDLKDMSDYLGGVTRCSEVSPIAQDYMIFLIWRNQFFNDEGWESHRYIKEGTGGRCDDYQDLQSMFYNDDIQKWLEKHKNDKVFYIEVDDNEPPKDIPWEIAREITSHPYDLFNYYKTDNVYCLGGK